jgi:long-chain acyl-CoA synthetase
VPPIAGAVVLGDGRPFVAAAVFVPAAALGRLRADHPDVGAALLARLSGALSAFSEYERPKRLLVLPGTPGDHPGLLTPTLKLKRDAFLTWAGAEVDVLYRQAAVARAAHG